MSDPVTPFAQAASEYARALGGGGVGGAEAGEAPADTGFAGMVEDALKTAIDSGRTSERVSIAALTEGTDLSQVVTAVAEAEATLQTVIAVRDRVLEAYKDIIRMPI